MVAFLCLTLLAETSCIQPFQVNKTPFRREINEESAESLQKIFLFMQFI